MPVKTSKAFLTVLGVPEKPQISGFTSPVMEGERMQLTCKTSGSKPAADIRWFKNDKEIKDVKYLKEEDANRRTFTVSSTLDFRADRSDDGAVVRCRVDHESLNSTPQIAMQVLEIHSIRSHTSCSVHAGALLRSWDSIMVTSADELCTHLQLATLAKQEIEIQKFVGLFQSTSPVYLS
ncbi:Cell adhesion molecule 2 [Chelonia mydas]|uniref:Cell adhesion molecule 2 n=1 Tax=Chelonia mydas TaxID=8469 RepID=M7C320_CHEMY|nr:Cell adhesion molecule 2 [Chelonia mydas]